MTDKGILKKAVEKAVKGGYSYELRGFNYDEDSDHWKNKYMLNGFIFSHSFAKAFWGEEIICKDCGGEVMRSANTDWYCVQCEGYTPTIKYFLYCFQQMVLEPEPLKYLEKFIK